jgi:hypothetical protein
MVLLYSAGVSARGAEPEGGGAAGVWPAATFGAPTPNASTAGSPNTQRPSVGRHVTQDFTARISAARSSSQAARATGEGDAVSPARQIPHR